MVPALPRRPVPTRWIPILTAATDTPYCAPGAHFTPTLLGASAGVKPGPGKPDVAETAAGTSRAPIPRSMIAATLPVLQVGHRRCALVVAMGRWYGRFRPLS